MLAEPRRLALLFEDPNSATWPLAERGPRGSGIGRGGATNQDRGAPASAVGASAAVNASAAVANFF